MISLFDLFWCYLTGCAVMFVICALLRNHVDAHEPQDKRTTVVMTILSWIGLMIMFAALMHTLFYNKKDEK